MTFVVSPINHWHELPTTGPTIAMPLARMYWAYDTPTSTWTLTDDSTQRDGELVDMTGAGTFTLEFLGVAAPSDPRLVSARRSGTILTYRGSA